MTTDYNNLSREQAIDLVGQASVEALDNEHCEPTSRLLPGEDPDSEFVASVKCEWDGQPARLRAIYFQSADEMLKIPEDGDMSVLDWEIDHYRLA